LKVAIIGGGIVGSFIAYYLSREGVDVTIYEKSSLGSGSVHAAGLIEPYRFDKINTTGMIKKMLSYVGKKVTIVKQLNPEWIKSLLSILNKEPPQEAWDIIRRMATFSLKEYKRMAEEVNDFDYEENGLLEIYQDRLNLEHGVEEEKRNPFNPKFEVIDVKGFSGAIYFPELSKLNTYKFMERMKRELKGVKIEIREIVNLDEISKGYDTVVLSAGVWLSKLGMPITSFKGYGYRVSGEMLVKYPSVISELGVAVVKNSDHIKITGGFDADFSADVERAKIFLDAGGCLAKIDKVYDLSMGYRPCSPDGFPIIGRVGQFVISTGACRLGWSFGPSMGKFTADLVLDRVKSYGYLSRLLNGRNLSVPKL